MQDQAGALIAGTNQGIGFQIAKELAEQGFTVPVGSRTFVRGETASGEIGTNAQALQLDVTDPASIKAAAGRVRR